MFYPHHKKAIKYITEKFKADSDVLALLISGSLVHGFNDEKSDVDLNIVVTEEACKKKNAEHKQLFFEEASKFYENGYFDGKFISLSYLRMVAERGNEPTRYALHDVVIAFDKTGEVEGIIKEIGDYGRINAEENTIRFLSQFDSWNWFCYEAIKKKNRYLLDLAVNKLILFGARLILLENKMFFPYHKWLLKTVENASVKPDGFIGAVEKLLNEKTEENIKNFYEMVKEYKDWANGREYFCFDYFYRDVETVWISAGDCVDNI